MGNLKIWVIGHRPTTEPYPENETYSSIQVGNADTFLQHRDNTGDNISEWNPVYCEMTAPYWIWKNTELPKYVGMCHYRRRLLFKEDEVEKIMKYCDVIAAEPLNVGNVLQNYINCHSWEDMWLAVAIIRDKFPQYAEGWEKYIRNDGILYYANGFIMRRHDFEDYCDFYFSFAEEFRKRKGWNDIQGTLEMIKSEIERGRRANFNGKGGKQDAVRYQSEVLGFLSERLLTLYLRTNFKNIYHTQYRKLEGC